MEVSDKNTTEDLDVEITPNNVDPKCAYSNKSRAHGDNLWKNKEAERAFETWFEKECYFN